MPHYKHKFRLAHVPSDHRHVAAMPLQDHRIRSRSIGPAPVVGVDGGTTTLARDFQQHVCHEGNTASVRRMEVA